MSVICVTGSGAPHHKWNHGMFSFAFYFNRRRDFASSANADVHIVVRLEMKLFCFVTVSNSVLNGVNPQNIAHMNHYAHDIVKNVRRYPVNLIMAHVLTLPLNNEHSNSNMRHCGIA